MTRDTRLRRYLIGDVTDDDALAVEQEYFHSEEAAQEVERVEEELIEDFLDGRLDPDEREGFARVYLASPVHRVRVDAIRRLRRQASTKSRSLQWLALAAAVLIVIIGAASLLIPGWQAPRTTAERQGPPATPPQTVSPPRVAEQPAARVFALSLSPINVRGAAETSPAVIPPGTDVVSLRFQGDIGGAPLIDPRVVIATVEGREVWSGPARLTDAAAGFAARADVPADRLPPNDYVVRLAGGSAAGIEQERARYFLRIRAQ